MKKVLKVVLIILILLSITITIGEKQNYTYAVNEGTEKVKEIEEIKLNKSKKNLYTGDIYMLKIKCITRYYKIC